MRPLTYFAFTLLSVVIQFCVMDFIQEKVEIDENPIAYNESINKHPIDMLKDEPNTLALYYRSNKNGYEKLNELSGTKYPNSSLRNVSISTSTEIAFTVFDVYDENGTTTDITFTTEILSSTELDNVTEITLFEESSTTTRPNTGTKKTKPGDVCYCNLLYKQCDINCCCDEECSLSDKELFDKCNNFWQQKKHPLECGETSTRTGFGNLLCIAKTNLPDQRVVEKPKIDKASVNDEFLWNEKQKHLESYNFNRNIYKFGEPVWILRNKSIYYLDLPVPVINNYCNVRRTMTFLNNENINCQIKLNDLEMFRVLKIVEESFVISVTSKSLNNTVMNCSSLHCTNWTIIYCDQDICVPYNKSLHSPICAESVCNIALKMEYIFNIYDSKIVNATIKLYAEKITPTLYVMQEIGVKFLIGNTSSERVVTLSGNPGYIFGLPIITSFTETNHTDNFFNSTNEDNYMSYAENKRGFCVQTKLTKKTLQFGINKRSKCRIILRQTSITNGTEACINIQKDIIKMAGVNRRMYFSPYGNPDNLKDDDWLPLKLESRFIYGEFQYKRSKLQCLNICTRYAFVFTYADLSDIGMGNKLLGVILDGSPSNVTFESEEYTTVITIDINFINIKSANRRVLAAPPHLNLNLPRDFFFPFPSNVSSISKCNIYLIFYSFLITLYVLK